MSLSEVTVTWDQNDVGQAPLGGTITFALSEPLADQATGATYSNVPPKSYFFTVGTGSSDPLIANDSTDLTPAGSYYTITVSIRGQQPYVFATFVNFADGATQTLGFLQANAAVPQTAYAQYLLLPSGTAAAGDAPVATGAGNATAWKPVLLFPSGDTTGAADAAAIIAAIQPVAGGIPGVRLAPGVWWLNQTVTVLANSTVIEGAGAHATRVNAAAGFTGGDVLDSGGFQFVTVKGLSVIGPAGSLGGATQLNGLRKRSGARFTGRDLFFTGLNGWGWYTDASGTDSQMTMDNVRVQNCAGGHYLHGTHTGQVAAVLAACSFATPMGTATGPAAGLQPFQVEDYWDLESFGMAPTVVKGNCVSCTFIGADLAPPVTTQPAVLLEDGPNGSPQGIVIGDGIIQDGSIGVQITGGASKITLHDLQVSFNQTHGVSVEGTATQVRLVNVDHYHNGKSGSGTNYDLNWTSTGSGKVTACTYDTAVGSGTTTVAASVNNAAGTVQHLGGTFPQGGTPGTQYTNPAGNASFTPADPSSTVSGTLVMMGLGAACAFTPQGTGRVLVTVTGGASTLAAIVTGTVGCRFGTGAAPVNGAAVTGTRFGAAADVQFKSSGVPATVQTFAFTGVLALTPGTAYWFDLALDTSNPSDAAEVKGVAMSIAELP